MTSYSISSYEGCGARLDECIVSADGVKVYGPASRDYCESWIAGKLNPGSGGVTAGPRALARLFSAPAHPANDDPEADRARWVADDDEVGS